MKAKRFISAILITLLVASFGVQISANNKMEGVDETRQFESIDDETGLKTSGFPIFDDVTTLNIERAVAGTVLWQKDTWAGATLYTEKAISTGDSTISKEFVKYLTTSWAKASSYAWSESVSVQWTLSGGLAADVYNGIKANLQLSSSRTTTYATAINIPAVDTKFSKLGFASDFFVQNFKRDYYVNGIINSTSSASMKTPTVNTYLMPYYQ